MVKVVSNKIFIYRNGDSLFAVSDDDLTSGTVALYCESLSTFDNVYIKTIEGDPEIFISEPISYSVHVSNPLDVSAYVNNAPGGSSVEFRLYDEQTDILVDQATGVESSNGYFTAQLSSLPTANYTLVAILLDSSGIEVERDTNLKIGIQGEYGYTLGDSITNGAGDNFWFDNISVDERIIAFSGYQAKLSDLLTVDFSYPHIFINEAVGGDETFDTLARIDSIKQRHPGANRVILLIGTNDSGGMFPVMSGKGCSGDCSGTYKGNMLQLRDIIFEDPDIDALTVALVPPAFGPSPYAEPFQDPLLDTTRNQIIQDYNYVIKNEVSNIEIGPDLFNFFINKFSLFRDNYHPNALGHLVLSFLFFDPTGNTLPFLLQNLSPSTPADYPSTYKQNLLMEGSQYYIDRSYTLINIPNVLAGGIWIMTANNDKSITSTNHISFDIDRQCKVYVAYDSRAASLPTWLGDNFTLTSHTVEVSDQDMGYFNVYEKSFSPGTVTLGGNRAPGASGGGSNYIAIVVEQ
jgi:lysophospholipase L1-like esterase